MAKYPSSCGVYIKAYKISSIRLCYLRSVPMVKVNRFISLTLNRGCSDTRCGFLQISNKTVVFRATCTVYIHISLPHMLGKCQTQVAQGQVTRSLQVTSPQKSLKARHSYTKCPITLKLCEIDICTSIYGISIFVTQGQINFATSPL